jgi:hypothetical protein
VSDKTLVLSEQAVKGVENMSHHLGRIGMFFGETSDQYRKAVRSYAHVMSGLMRSGFSETARIARDGDLSLYVSEGTFVYGVIWHGVRRACIVDGCKAYLKDDGQAYTYNREDHVCAAAHIPSYPYDAPAPGEWSTHS